MDEAGGYKPYSQSNNRNTLDTEHADACDLAVLLAR